MSEITAKIPKSVFLSFGLETFLEIEKLRIQPSGNIIPRVRILHQLINEALQARRQKLALEKKAAWKDPSYTI